MTSSPKVLYICEKLPHNIRGGNDLRVRSQIIALSEFCTVGVIGLGNPGPTISEKIDIWKSGNLNNYQLQNKLITSLFDKDNGDINPYQILYEETTAKLIHATILKFQPEVIIFSKLLTTIYLDVIKKYSTARIILDMDESAHRQITNLKPLTEDPIHRITFIKWHQALINFENDLIKIFDQVWLSSKVEITSILNLDPSLKSLKYVPNAISIGEYHHQKRTKDDRKIVFTGNFAYGPNLRAAGIIIDELALIMPEFDFCLAGSNIPNWIKKVTASNVKIFENIENMGDFLLDSFLSIVPLTEGCGTRLKVLEAFASKIPVISTTVGVEGLELTPGHHYLEANSPVQFGEYCKMMLVESQKYSTISSNAYEFVQKNHSISKLSSDLQSFI